MKFKIHAFDWLAIAFMAMPPLYLMYVYNDLPASVATHFDFSGRPNDYTNKSELWHVFLLLGGLSLGIFLLVRFLPQIDPKKYAKYSTDAYNKIAVAVVLFMNTISLFMLYSAKNDSFELFRILPAALGLFLAILGNFMHNIKPNYFVGVRTPWTLESPETWRKTHQLAGKLWFAGGLVIAVLSLMLPLEYANYFVIAGIVLLALIPCVYSYICFRALQKGDVDG